MEVNKVMAMGFGHNNIMSINENKCKSNYSILSLISVVVLLILWEF